MLGNFRADSLSMQKTRKKANEFSDANQILKKKKVLWNFALNKTF
jgi:hypothetical protein